jgi:hypothetical protein
MEPEGFVSRFHFFCSVLLPTDSEKETQVFCLNNKGHMKISSSGWKKRKVKYFLEMLPGPICHFWMHPL